LTINTDKYVKHSYQHNIYTFFMWYEFYINSKDVFNRLGFQSMTETKKPDRPRGPVRFLEHIFLFFSIVPYARPASANARHSI
jgi:hypothetical protein